MRHAHRHRPQVPARPAGHRLPVGAHRRPRPAGSVRRRDRLGDLGRAPGLHLGARRQPVRYLGAQLRQRPGSRRGRPAGPRPGPGGDRAARYRARRPAPRTARRAARRQRARPRPQPLRHRHRQDRRAGDRSGGRGPGRGRGQRLHHRGRAQPARHPRPRRPPADPVVSALLQHRGRDRPRDGARRPAGRVTGTAVTGIALSPPQGGRQPPSRSWVRPAAPRSRPGRAGRSCPCWSHGRSAPYSRRRSGR